MSSKCCEFVDSRLRRSPPDRASAVPYGQAGENAMRFPHLAHRSAADHKLHSTRQQHEMKLISGNGETSSRLPAFSLFLPGTCPNNRDRRITITSMPHSFWSAIDWSAVDSQRCPLWEGTITDNHASSIPVSAKIGANRHLISVESGR